MDEHVSAKADPELLKQLEETERRASAGDEPEPVEAVFTLGQGVQSYGTEPAQALPPPEEVERTSRELVERVQGRTGVRIEVVNVFRYLNSFVVVGDPAAIRTLLQEPEILSAVANRQPGEIDLLGSKEPDVLGSSGAAREDDVAE